MSNIITLWSSPLQRAGSGVGWIIKGTGWLWEVITQWLKYQPHSSPLFSLIQYLGHGLKQNSPPFSLFTAHSRNLTIFHSLISLWIIMCVLRVNCQLSDYPRVENNLFLCILPPPSPTGKSCTLMGSWWAQPASQSVRRNILQSPFIVSDWDLWTREIWIADISTGPANIRRLLPGINTNHSNGLLLGSVHFLLEIYQFP